MKPLFWLSLFFVFYAYIGYPLILIFLSTFRRREVKRGNIQPGVSFIITVYNEENRILEKIENTLKQDYPKDKFEIIIASDASTDRTDGIVRSYSSRGVRLVRAPERKGKENAQKYAVDVARGEIFVFSDVATRLDRDGVSKIVRSFSDSTVGCVSSVDRFIDKGGRPGGEGVYVRYEMFQRDLESNVNSLVGLSGSFFAARREVCHPWAGDLQSDFNILLNAVREGYRGICDHQAIGSYPDVINPGKERIRKVRTVVRGIRVLMRNYVLFNPFRYGLFSWQLASHKLCRWLVPFALIVAFITNLLRARNSNTYLALFLVQCLFYGLAVSGWFLGSNRLFLKIPYFFLMVNATILEAWFRYLKGDHFITWEPSAR